MNDCNNTDNIIEFTPQEKGNIKYTCSMGMISSNIKVVSDVTKVNPDDKNEINNYTPPVSSGGGCCGG